MRVGDIVQFKNLHGHVFGGKFISKRWIGIIVETEVCGNNGDVMVAWGEMMNVERKSSLQVVNESR
mgnify:FL=1